MKVNLFRRLQLLCLGFSLFAFQLAHAQKSVAEVVGSIPPPQLQGQIPVNDGNRGVTMFNNHLFVTNFWVGLQVIDMSDISHPKPVGVFPVEEEAHYTFIEAGKAYLANQAGGVQMFDISDMNNIRKIAQIKTPGNAYWVDARYPYLYVALGKDGFCIMDISDVNNPVTLSLEIPEGWVNQLTVQDNKLFVSAKRGGMWIYDISNPSTPQALSQFKTNYHVTMVQVSENFAYIADGPGGLLIMDVSNPEFPTEIKRLSLGGFAGYLHQVGNYVYVANRDIGLQIVNISDKYNPILESSFVTSSRCYAVYKKDIYVYLAANTATLILRHNNAPLLEPLTDLVLKENQPFSLQLKATEPDGDPILFEAQNLPEGSSFDPQTGLFTWRPSFEQSGVYSNVIFKVIEQTQSRLFAADTITITVEHVNRPPELPSLADTTINENQSLTIVVPEGSDPDREDAGKLTYRAENLPVGATFDPVTRTFTWTPTFDQSGIYVVDFVLADGAGGEDREPVTITVNHVDRPPQIDPIADQNVDEGDTLKIKITGTEPDKEDQDKISFAMENLPEGAVFDAAQQLFTWVPNYDQSGVYPDILAIMKAGKLSDSTSFTITVNHVNRPPVLSEIGDKEIDEGKLLEFTISGSDPDKEDTGKLAFTAENLPPGARFDADSLKFVWTPNFEQSGEYPGIVFKVTDPQGLSDQEQITIVVHHVNRPPEIQPIADVVGQENQPISIQLVASDPDKEDAGKLRFRMLNAPEGATLEPESGLFTWTPTFEQSGEYSVTFVVSDGQYQDSTTARITVQHVNRPPVLAELLPQTVDENTLLEFQISGTDPDREDEGKLRFYARNLPEGAQFDSTTRTFRWTPNFEQSGEYEVTFGVADPAGLSDEKSVKILVKHVNRPPELAGVAPQQVDENTPLTFQLVGSDPDREDAGKLTYSADNLPQGAVLDAQTGQFNWTPSFDQAGTYQFVAMVKDPAGLTDTARIKIQVNNVNRPPQIVASGPQQGRENEPLTFVIQATDPDKEDQGKLVFSATGLPEGAVLDAQTGQFSWTPTFEQSGDYVVHVVVTDGYGATAEADFPISIAHVNRLPEVPDIPEFTLRENEPFQTVLPEATDPDKEDEGKLTYTVVNPPIGVTFDPATRTFSWTPTFEQAGDYTLTYQVNDSEGSVKKEFKIRVENVNRPPVLEALPAVTVQEGQEVVIPIKASDPDREDQEKLQFEFDGLPDGASFRKDSREIVWKPGFDQAGQYTVQVRVRDGEAEAQGQLVIEVENVNRPPEIEAPSQETIKEGETLKFKVKASDPDKEDKDKLRISANNLPSGAAFDAASGEFSWTPDKDQQGEYSVTFQVEDGGGLQSSTTVKIIVEDVPEETGTPEGNQ